MDPNYKNFIAWKKSIRGKEFLQQKDQEEINNLRQIEEIGNNPNPISEQLPIGSQKERKINNSQNDLESSEFRILNDHLEGVINEIGHQGPLDVKNIQNINSKISPVSINTIKTTANNLIQNSCENNRNNFTNNIHINNINSNINSNINPLNPLNPMENSNPQPYPNSSNNITKNNISYNFDTKRNKELILKAYNNDNLNSIPQANPIPSKMNNSYVQSKNVNNSSNFNKIYHAVQNNSMNSNNSNLNISSNNLNNSLVNNKSILSKNFISNNPKSQKKKSRNIQFQLIARDLCAIESDFWLEPAIMTVIKEFGGRFDRESRIWNVPYKQYIELFNNLKKMQIADTNLHPISNLPVEVIANIQYNVLKFKIDNSNFEINYSNDRIHSLFELPSSMLSNLYSFQKAGIEFGVKKKGRMLLADEMGVGKTIQAVGISAIFKENWPVLILCPSSLKYNWRDEICNWLKDIITKHDVQIVKTGKDGLKEGRKFYICSYDLAIRIHEKISDKGFQFAIADEAHYLKSSGTKRVLHLVPILQKCKRVLLLSGTPILAKPIEIYTLLKILRPDLFHSVKAFGTRYCDPKPNPWGGGVEYNGSANPKELHFILSNIMIRRLKKDVLSELPPKKRQKIEVQTDKKMINQIRVLLNKSSKVDLDNENILSKLINDDNVQEEDSISCFTKAYALTGKAKIVGIRDYIGYLLENNCKFLIFAHHLEVLDKIEEEVKGKNVKYIRIDGSIQNEKRHILVNTFQTDDRCLVAVLAITACATGLTLTKASTVVFAEMHFTPAIMIQAEDRAHRIGQEHNCVNVHYLYGTDTVDELIFPKLREKFFVVSSTLDDKRMDMDLQKLKSGTIGDFETKKKSEMSEEELIKSNNSVNNIKNPPNANSSSVNKVNNISTNIFHTSSESGKKKLTLTDYFNPKPKKVEEKKEICEVNEQEDDDDIINLLEQDEEFVKSLSNSEVKLREQYKFDGEDILNEEGYQGSNFSNVRNINLHNGVIKRNRLEYDDDFNEFSLIENPDDASHIDKKRKVNKINSNEKI